MGMELANDEWEWELELKRELKQKTELESVLEQELVLRQTVPVWTNKNPIEMEKVQFCVWALLELLVSLDQVSFA